VRRAEGQEVTAERLTLSVEGMTCSHCQAAVTRALEECPGVRTTQVDLKSGQALVEGDKLDEGALCAAVTELGYKAHGVGQMGHSHH
jgi:copper chaperone